MPTLALPGECGRGAPLQGLAQALQQHGPANEALALPSLLSTPTAQRFVLLCVVSLLVGFIGLLVARVLHSG
jgi:hypothetical protein